MNNFQEVLKNKKSLIGFLTAGDPNLNKTKEMIISMNKAGVNVVEVGIPFSDASSGGADIEASNVRALNSGTTTDKILDMICEIKKEANVEIVLSSYANPIFIYGYDNFFKKCKDVGVKGVIIPDIPYEESFEVTSFSKKYDVDFINMIMTKNPERIRKIAKQANGYIYLVPVGCKDEGEIKEILDLVKEESDIPVVLDNSAITEKECEMACGLCEGVVIKRKVIEYLGDFSENSVEKVYEYFQQLNGAIDNN